VGTPIIVVGLGNPGEEYRHTRHNVGFWVVDRLARRGATSFRLEGELRKYGWSARARLAAGEVLLFKPRTYMNRSGRAVSALCRAHDTDPRDLVVVYDDADLELGRLRIRQGGGAGGHNGVRSLIDVMGQDDFVRVRLGVRGEGRDEQDLADYVLAEFDGGERAAAEELADVAAEAVECLVGEGLPTAMNRFNGVRIAGSGGAVS